MISSVILWLSFWLHVISCRCVQLRGGSLGANTSQLHAPDAFLEARRQQRRRQRKNQVDAASIELQWLHIPKCGSSFVNTMITWGCPGLPADEKMDRQQLDVGGVPTEWIENHNGQCDFDRMGISCVHSPVDQPRCTKPENGGYAAMFRQPEQRIMSGFYWGWGFPFFDHNLDILEYARYAEGCATRMMTGRLCMSGSDQHVPTEDDVESAIKKLDDFVFVGLTEEWEMSICLFHRMFGGECQEREFVNLRAGPSRTDDEYNTSILDGFVDEFDGAIYEAVKLRFSQALVDYAVTPKSCRRDGCTSA